MNSNQPTTPTGQKKKWDRLRRRRLMLLAYKRITVAQIAREVSRSRLTVSTVVHYYPKSKSHVIQEHLAERLNVPYERLWGAADDHKAIVANKKRAVND